MKAAQHALCPVSGQALLHDQRLGWESQGSQATMTSLLACL